MKTEKASLILADGTVFSGYAFGSATNAPAVGELVFTTGMTGYQESLTDPSYAGQIVCQTFPSIGNCGANAFDSESSRGWPKGYVVREWCRHPSNFRSEETIDKWLQAQGIPGIFGIDTRALTRRLRQQGAMNAVLLHGDAGPDDIKLLAGGLAQARPLAGAVYAVTCTAPEAYPPKGDAQYRVVLYDYGAKDAIRRRLAARGCEVITVPCHYSASDAKALRPDGIMLSNGPGDPAEYTDLVTIVRQLLEWELPLFGVCLGHQLLARAMGAQTEKLKFGHRGANQPVTDLATGRTFVTSQNHGYAVVAQSVQNGQVSHINANDQSVEGISYPDKNAFSVQFHPEACAGPEDTERLFDNFVAMMRR